MWFVIATEKPAEVRSVIEENRGGRVGLAVLNLPKLEEYFLELETPGMTVAPSTRSTGGCVQPASRAAADRARPYHALAEQLGLAPEDVMARLRRHPGVRRDPPHRCGAEPLRARFRANGMTVWDVDDQRLETLGAKVGALDFVSHCYLRPRRSPHWPYNLFAMVHGRTRVEVEARSREIAALLGDAARAHDVLYSTRILKKTGLRLAGNRKAMFRLSQYMQELDPPDAAQGTRSRRGRW